jgi:hypothetical protein
MRTAGAIESQLSTGSFYLFYYCGYDAIAGMLPKLLD